MYEWYTLKTTISVCDKLTLIVCTYYDSVYFFIKLFIYKYNEEAVRCRGSDI